MAFARGSIDADADRVVRRLARSGFKAYLVGGCVRDILLGRAPKDFDVATSATPNEIKQLFRNCRIIGRRFRLAHVFFGQKIIETSTFRANPKEDAEGDEELLIRRDNVFGSEIEDARRRDFTINGLFYDVETEQVIDHVGGMQDLDARLIRTIGDPDIRFREDPVRMLRAIKFAARLGFSIEGHTYQALLRHRGEISKCAAPRVLEEVYRLLRGGAARRSVELLIETGVASVLSPQLAAMFGVTDEQPAEGGNGVSDPDGWNDVADYDSEEREWRATWFGELVPRTSRMALSFVRDPDDLERRRAHAWKILDELDRHVAAGDEISNSLALAAFMAAFVLDSIVEPGSRPADANNAIIEIGQPLIDELRVARRDAERARQTLLALRRLVPARKRRGRGDALAGRDYFDDALLLLSIAERAAGRELPEPGPHDEEGDGADGPDDGLEADGADGPDGVEGADGEVDDGLPRKRRRRRRGGRRRRRGDADEIHGAAAG